MIFNINDMKGMKQKDMFIVLIVLVVIVLVYGFLFKYLGGVDAGNSSMHLLKIFLLGVFTFLVLVNGLKYFFDYLKGHHSNPMADYNGRLKGPV